MDLSQNRIGDEGSVVLANAIMINEVLSVTMTERVSIACQHFQWQTLTNISLSDNKIGDKGIQALADALQFNQTLTSISLAVNEFSDAGRRVLLDAVQINRVI